MKTGQSAGFFYSMCLQFLNWNRMPIAALTARMIRKFGLWASENWSTEYFAISLPPESAVVIMPSGLMKDTAITPTMTPAAIASAIQRTSVSWNASMIVVETAKVATAKMQSFSRLKPNTPSTTPAQIGMSFCQVGSAVMCGTTSDAR